MSIPSRNSAPHRTRSSPQSRAVIRGGRGARARPSSREVVVTVAPRVVTHSFLVTYCNHLKRGRRWGDAGDRKSVVEGKSGSVRVDLGGCRVNTKKKQIWSDFRQSH